MRGKNFVADSIAHIRRDGLEGVSDTAYRIYKILWKRVDLLYDDRRTNIYDHDWDVLIVLDACRADMMRDAADRYEFITDVDSVRSNASKTKQWLNETFTADHAAEMSETAYVMGNPFSNICLRSEDFAVLDEVWNDEWDETLGTMPAEPITDRAINVWRSGDHERMIVHYMQPHFPSVPNPELGSGLRPDRFGKAWDSIWDRLRKGDISESTVRSAYRQNLEYVLESVELLVTSINAGRVVITADHGNSFGSWGLYGHPQAPIAAVRNVPWCELSARNTSGYEPADEHERASKTEVDVTSKLRDLGYL